MPRGWVTGTTPVAATPLGGALQGQMPLGCVNMAKGAQVVDALVGLVDYAEIVRVTTRAVELTKGQRACESSGIVRKDRGVKLLVDVAHDNDT